MKYVAVYSHAVTSAAFQTATRAQQAVWLVLLQYCAEQMNGGRIADCRTWNDAVWQRVARVRAREIFAPSGLWYFSADDLLVQFYPSDQEKSILAKVEGGRKGAAKRWVPAVLPNNTPPSLADGSPNGIADGNKQMNEQMNEVTPPARVVSFEMAKQWMAGEGYSDDEVKAQWAYYDSKRGPGGEWLTERGSIITDPRSALIAGMLRFGKKTAAAPGSKRERGEILQAMAMAKTAGDEKKWRELKEELDGLSG